MVIGLGLVTLSLINLYIQSNRIVTVVYPLPITETQVDTSLLANGEIETKTSIVQTTPVEKPKMGDILGVIEIPALKRELQLLEGTEEA